MVEFCQETLVLILQREIGGQTVVDVVRFDIIIYNGQLSFQNSCLERIECAVHQGYVIGVDSCAYLLYLVVLLGYQLCLGLHSGILQFTLGGGVPGFRSLGLIA